MSPQSADWLCHPTGAASPGNTVLQVRLLMNMRGRGSIDQCSELESQLPEPDWLLPSMRHGPADTSMAETV